MAQPPIRTRRKRSLNIRIKEPRTETNNGYPLPGQSSAKPAGQECADSDGCVRTDAESRRRQRIPVIEYHSCLTAQEAQSDIHYSAMSIRAECALDNTQNGPELRKRRPIARTSVRQGVKATERVCSRRCYLQRTRLFCAEQRASRSIMGSALPVALRSLERSHQKTIWRGITAGTRPPLRNPQLLGGRGTRASLTG